MATFRGTSGNDNISGTAVNDLIFGLAGGDVLNGLAGNDVISGGDGGDRINGGTGNDILAGGDGGDAIIGDSGNDSLIGGAGNDILIGTDPFNPASTGSERDTLVGGSGADQFVLGNVIGRFYDGPGPRFATIRDFSFSQGDRIVLQGSASQYSLNTTSFGNGTGIFTGNGQDLIAIVENVRILSFNQGFSFV